MSSIRLLATGLAAALLTATPALAEVIVVKASGPSAGGYPAGRKLPDRSTLTLKAGDILTVLDGQGTRTLRGPGIFGTNAPPTAGSDTRSNFAALISPRANRARTGAIRNGAAEAPPPRSPNLWYVDISQSTTACIADPGNVILWRPDNKADATVTASAKGGKSATIKFAAGASTAAWPADALPVAEGASYSLTWAGAAKPSQIGFSLLTGQTEGLEGMAATLISRKCDAQLDLLVATVALPEPAPIAPTG